MASLARGAFKFLVLAVVVGAIDFPDRYTAQVNRDDNSRHMGFDEDRSTTTRSDMLATLRDNHGRHERFSSGLEVGPDSTQWGHTVSVNFGTSHRQFSDSNATVHITFFGDRAVSDKMVLQQGFEQGARDSVQLMLQREIGSLLKIRLETDSTDGWMMSYLECSIEQSSYYFDPMTIFLDKPDEALPLLDPESRTAALYEPQAPSKTSPDDDASEGLLGVEMQEFKVARRADSFRNPVDYREKTRTDMAL